MFKTLSSMMLFFPLHIQLILVDALPHGGTEQGPPLLMFYLLLNFGLVGFAVLGSVVVLTIYYWPSKYHKNDKDDIPSATFYKTTLWGKHYTKPIEMKTVRPRDDVEKDEATCDNGGDQLKQQVKL